MSQSLPYHAFGVHEGYLHEQDDKLEIPRPWPLNQDADQREAFCERLQRWQNDP